MKNAWLASMVCSVLAVSQIAASADRGQVEVSRDRIVQAVSSSIVLSSRLMREMPAEDQAETLSELKALVPVVANDALPEYLTGSSPADVDEVLNQKVVVGEEGMAYARLLLKKRMMDVRIQLGFQMLGTPLSADDTQLLQSQVEALINGLQKSMSQHLSDYVPAEEMTEHLQRVRQKLMHDITDRNTYALKRPAQEQRIRDLLDEFEGRLAASVDRIPKRMERLQELPEGAARNEAEKALRTMIVLEVLSPAARIFSQVTADPDLAAVDAEQLAPGYGEVVRALGAMDDELLRARRTEEQQSAEAVSRVREEAQRERIASDLRTDELLRIDSGARDAPARVPTADGQFRVDSPAADGPAREPAAEDTCVPKDSGPSARKDEDMVVAPDSVEHGKGENAGRRAIVPLCVLGVLGVALIVGWRAWARRSGAGKRRCGADQRSASMPPGKADGTDCLRDRPRTGQSIAAWSPSPA